MSTLIMAGSLLGLNLGLLWLLIALPLGRRSIVVRRRFPIGCETLWQAIDPMGSSADWYSRVLSSRPEEGRPGIVEQTYDQMDRKGQPVRRQIEVVYDRPGAAGARGFAARVTDDSALDISFWSAFEEKRKVEPDGAGCRLTVVQTDRYRGLAFLIFRWFLLRRELDALANWVRTGEGRARGWIERPPTQFGLALLSILALWPFFGLTASGFFLSATLTIVIVLHELGHMLAYRACGHRSARMIIIPLLGGVAIGGRPYDSLFEVAFCALMGAGTSAFVVAGAMTLYPSVATTRLAEMLLAFVLIGGGFNLLNLAPVARFDGGHVLRQVMRGPRQLAAGSFAASLMLLYVGWRVGAPHWTLVFALAVLALMSLSLTTRSVRPRSELDVMTVPERVFVAAGFAAAVFVHGTAVIFAVQHLGA